MEQKVIEKLLTDEQAQAIKERLDKSLGLVYLNMLGVGLRHFMAGIQFVMNQIDDEKSTIDGAYWAVDDSAQQRQIEHARGLARAQAEERKNAAITHDVIANMTKK